MMRFASLALLATLAIGCTPVPSLRERLQPWIGTPELDLVKAFGVPAGTYEVDGVKFIQYFTQHTILAPPPPAMFMSFGPWGPAWGPAGYPTTVVVSCEITFALRRAVVESFSFRGEGCR
jgi:hypothetical protein